MSAPAGHPSLEPEVPAGRLTPGVGTGGVLAAAMCLPLRRPTRFPVRRANRYAICIY